MLLRYDSPLCFESLYVGTSVVQFCFHHSKKYFHQIREVLSRMEIFEKIAPGSSINSSTCFAVVPGSDIGSNVYQFLSMCFAESENMLL